MKNIPKDKKILYAGLVLAAVLLVVYPYFLKKFIVRLYVDQYSAIKKLEPAKQQEIDEAIRHIEKGEIFEAQEHDTQDFMHTDYFGEPWRIWANTFVIWEKARDLFFLFLFILLLKPYLNRIVDRLHIANLRARGIKAEYNNQIINF